MNKLSMRFLEKWLSIPRMWRKGCVTLVAFIACLSFAWKGLEKVFHGEVVLSWPTIVLSLILAFVMIKKFK
jgi:hypothetical protein